MHAHADPQPRFETVFEVAPEFLDQVRAAEAEFTQALDASSGASEFGRVQAAARDLPGASVVRIIPGFGLQDTVPGHIMVLTLQEAVRQAMARPFGNAAFWERAEAALTRAFSGLAEQEGAPYLRFLPQPADGDAADRDTDPGPETETETTAAGAGTGAGTRYDYHLLFALADEETEGFLYVIAFCVHVTVGLEKEQVLKLSIEDPAPYTLQLDALCIRQPLA
ncbi:Type-2Aa cytolytic delta-endotoxin [Streptomyces sp. NPDC002851]